MIASNQSRIEALKLKARVSRDSDHSWPARHVHRIADFRSAFVVCKSVLVDGWEAVGCQFIRPHPRGCREECFDQHASTLPCQLEFAYHIWIHESGRTVLRLGRAFHASIKDTVDAYAEMDFVGLAASTLTIARLCLKTANIIGAMQSFRSDLQSLYGIYNFEHVRLSLWLIEVLKVPPEQDTLQSDEAETLQLPDLLGSTSPIDLQAPIRAALYEVRTLLTEVKRLLDNYDTDSNGRHVSQNTSVLSGKVKISFGRRFKFQSKVYKEGDKERLRALLEEIKDWNDRLDALTESRLRAQVAANMRSRVLASASTTDQLQVVEDAARASYPILSNEAAFKRNWVTIDESAELPNIELKVHVSSLNPKEPPKQRLGNNLRCLGWAALESSGNARVLQEWKFGQLDWGRQEVALARQRTDKLARVLHLNNKPQQLCCLDLVGYALKDSTSGNRTRLDFCFLYKLPTFADSDSEPVTLLEILDPMEFPDGDRPTLAERFSLATTLAESVLCFHTHNWIHKAICSSNVIFFRDRRNKQVKYSKPYIAGFEFARPDTAVDRTLDAFQGNTFEIFCHPDLRQTLQVGRSTRPRYQRQYDIYGLGVILLEIGCWMPGAECVTSKPEDFPGSDHDFLLSICEESIPSRMGSKYRDIVRSCLTWRADDEKVSVSVGQTQEGLELRRKQVEEFMYTVVGSLRGCHCRL